MNLSITRIRIDRRNAIVRPGKHPICPTTDCAGIEYNAREFSNQSAHRVIHDRSGSRIRCFVVTPPTRSSANGFTNSLNVSAVHTVSESTNTVTSPVDIFVPIITAFRFPGIGVCVHRTNGANSSHTPTRPGFGAPLITTMISPGRCSTIRPNTSRNNSRGSSTTGTTTLVDTTCGSTYGRYRFDTTTLMIQITQINAEYTANR
ncbi:hypothetical protein GCM10009617_23190 [Leifsonia poae]